MTLALDPRRYAMLEAMGIKLWLPGRDAGADSRALPLPPLGEGGEGGGARRSARSPFAAPTPALPQRGREQIAAFEPSPRPEGIERMDWATLQSAVASCRACALCQRRKNAVFGVGPQGADWLVVGEAPGEEEDLAGEPFVGASGHLLDNMLKAISLRRGDGAGQDGGPQANVFIANVLKCRPPNNRNPEPREVAQCAPYLRRQIELLQPRIILAVGRFASNALLQGVVPEVERVPLGKLRGKVYRYQNMSKGTPVVVTYHPAYLLRNLAAKAQAWEDLCLALDVMGRHEPAPQS